MPLTVDRIKNRYYVSKLNADVRDFNFTEVENVQYFWSTKNARLDWIYNGIYNKIKA